MQETNQAAFVGRQSRLAQERLIATGRQRGHIPPRPPKQDTPKSKCKRLGLNLGSIQRVLDTLHEDQQDWVLDQCIALQMESVEEWIIETIRDLYEENAK